ncbi:MAG: phospholipase D-like domain-containing protein [Nitriliruptorales bacterium]|nr:phospholipase D-like domain-containing protein [Nitriliruptorales bacterium]
MTRSWISQTDRRRLLVGLTGTPIVEGCNVELLHDEEILPAMLEAIRAAEHTVDLMTYIWWGGEVAERFAVALADRARNGVRVRLLLDSVGSRDLDEGLEQQMRDAGVTLEYFRPRWSWKLWQLNMRTHRRVLVCDDHLAFTGGVGIAQEWMGTDGVPAWRETHLRVTGPAVDGIHAGFYTDWVETPRPPVDENDSWPERMSDGSVDLQVLLASSQPGWNTMALALNGLIDSARERLRITTAYFRPPRHFRRLLCQTAKRGVEVEVLVPGPHAEPVISRHAAQHHYGELLEHGIRLFEYQPTMLHAKVVTVDGTTAMVGTTNFDARSLALNEQISVVLHDEELTRQLDQRFDDDVSKSEQIDLEAWRRRPVTDRAKQWLGHASTFPIRGAAATKRGRIVGDPPTGDV